MSMILSLTELGDPNVARLLADPPLVWQVISPDDPERYEQARSEASRPFILKRLFSRSKAPDAAATAPPLVLGDGEGESADLDKAWHGIHYLLTGSAWEGEPPLNLLVAGGREVGHIDVGYGAARVLSAAEVRAAAESLAALRDDDLRARFNPAEMMSKKIYPEIWDRSPEEDDTLGYLLESVGTLREFLSAAVERGHGAVITVT
jgi:hypothetical protein